MKILGYLFFGIGVLLIFGVIFLTFSFYNEVTEATSSLPSLPQTQDIMTKIDKLIENINRYMGLGLFLTIRVLILFVLLEAGFKLSQIGYNITKEKGKG
ncbi:MAG: hypothetical protein ACP5FX_01985 [Candidatus Micrarchaeia archaeon]